MLIVHTAEELQNSLKSKSASLGLVPTMGALHQGHLSLVSRAANENKKVVVSIYVNPTQFNHSKDLDNYPKDIDKDIDLLKPFEKQYSRSIATVGIYRACGAVDQAAG